jgi:hypothetical protein
MTEPAPEPYAPQSEHEPREPALEDALVNTLWGLALFGAFIVLFVGTFVVGIVYLAFD